MQEGVWERGMGGKGRESSRRQTPSPKRLGPEGPGPQLEPRFPRTWLIFSGLWGGGAGGGDSFKGTGRSWGCDPQGCWPLGREGREGSCPSQEEQLQPRAASLPGQRVLGLSGRATGQAPGWASALPLPGRGQAASPNDRDGRTRPCGKERLLDRGLSKTGGHVPAARVCPRPGIPKAEAEVTHTPSHPHTPLLITTPITLHNSPILTANIYSEFTRHQALHWELYLKHHSKYRRRILLSPFNRWEHWGRESWSNLPKGTQLLTQVTYKGSPVKDAS